MTTKNAAGLALIDNVCARELSGRIALINGLTNPDDFVCACDDLALRQAQKAGERQ